MFWLELVSSDFQQLVLMPTSLGLRQQKCKFSRDDTGAHILHNSKEVEEAFMEIYKSQVNWATVVIFITANGPTGKHRKTNCCQIHFVGI